MDQLNEDGKTIQSIETAFSILETMKNDDEANLATISRELGVAKSTVYNHLVTLEQLGYVVKSGDRYRIGLRFLDIGDHARIQYDLYEIAKPEADELASQTNERCQVMVAEGNYGVYIYQTKGKQAITTDSHVGTRVDFHSTAVGKAYMAHLPEERLDELLDELEFNELTNRTIVDRPELLDELAEIRERGYAFNDEERIMGMRAVGAPIVSDKGTVLGSLSVSGPTTRLQGTWYHDELPEMLSRISRVIGIKATYP